MSPYVETTGEIAQALKFGPLPNEEIETADGIFAATMVDVSKGSYINFLRKEANRPPKYTESGLLEMLSEVNMPEDIAKMFLNAIAENKKGFRIELKTNFLPSPPDKPNIRPRNFIDYKIISDEQK